MNYPKHFYSRINNALYVFNSKKEETDGVSAIYIHGGKPTRGSLPWFLSEMKVKDGFKPATVAQIRHFVPDYKPAPRKPAVKITPLHPKLTLPKGFVYLGKGREFKRPDDKSFRGIFAEVRENRVTWPFGKEDLVNGAYPEYYYAAKIGSPVALLNGHKVKTSALKTALSKLAASEVRCAALTEENLRLKAIIAASKKELEKA